MKAHSIRLTRLDRQAIAILATAPQLKKCPPLAAMIEGLMTEWDKEGDVVEITTKILSPIDLKMADLWAALAILVAIGSELDSSSGFQADATNLRRFFAWLATFVIVELKSRFKAPRRPGGPMN